MALELVHKLLLVAKLEHEDVTSHRGGDDVLVDCRDKAVSYVVVSMGKPIQPV